MIFKQKLFYNVIFCQILILSFWKFLTFPSSSRSLSNKPWFLCEAHEVIRFKVYITSHRRLQVPRNLKFILRGYQRKTKQLFLFCLFQDFESLLPRSLFSSAKSSPFCPFSLLRNSWTYIKIFTNFIDL